MYEIIISSSRLPFIVTFLQAMQRVGRSRME